MVWTVCRAILLPSPLTDSLMDLCSWLICLSFSPHRTAIYNRFSLSYAMAQHIVDSGAHQTPFKGHPVGPYKLVPTPQEALVLLPGLRLLLAGARVLRRERRAAGALELESLKLEFNLDGKAQPVEIGTFSFAFAHSCSKPL